MVYEHPLAGRAAFIQGKTGMYTRLSAPKVFK